MEKIKKAQEFPEYSAGHHYPRNVILDIPASQASYPLSRHMLLQSVSHY